MEGFVEFEGTKVLHCSTREVFPGVEDTSRIFHHFSLQEMSWYCGGWKYHCARVFILYRKLEKDITS